MRSLRAAEPYRPTSLLLTENIASGSHLAVLHRFDFAVTVVPTAAGSASFEVCTTRPFNPWFS